MMAFWRGAAAGALCVGVVGLCLAAEEQDPQKLSQSDPEFAVQGEYVGEVPGDGENRKFGLQVIALGEGKLRGVAFRGGLPGAGWEGSDRIEAEGELQDGTAHLRASQGSAKIRQGVAEIFNADGERVGELKRIERVSPTAGLKPPAGARVLFDGTAGAAFENARVTAEGFLQGGVTSQQKFGSCTVHLEFRTPFEPKDRGQQRGNSGCYLQGRYEVQILDSFGLAGKNNEAGGIYEISDPKVNMCLPPLAWQTYDIDYTAATYDAAGKKTGPARITVRHNGVVVQDNVELPRATRAAPVPEGPEPGPLYLQDHGDAVRFRNVWVLEKK